MKIVKEVFSRFLSVVKLTGSIELKECLAVGSKKSLKVCAVTPSKTFALKAELLGDYSELETIGIDDLGLLEKTIGLMDDVDLSKKDNKLVLKSKEEKNKLLLRSPKYVLTILEETQYDKVSANSRGNEFTLTKEDIARISRHYDVFKSNISISGVDNEVVVKIGEDNSSEIKIKIKEKVKEFDVSLAGLFVEALNTVSDNVKLSIKTDMPVIVNAETAEYKVEYFIAPLKRKEEKK